MRGGGVCLLTIAGWFPMQGSRPDSTYTDLAELEVVGNAVREEVKSSVPMFQFDDQRMKQMGVTDLTDALHRLPGLNIRDYGGAGGMKTVSVRGFGTTHTGVIYDGVALSDAQSGSIDLSRYSLDNVDELALVVGDNNDIFSPAKSVASAATIVINTGGLPMAADSLLHIRAQLRFGAWRLINPYLKIGKTLSPHLSISASGEFTHAKNNYPYTLKNGIQTTRERRENSRMNMGHGEMSLRWRPTQASALDAKVYYYDNDRELPGPVVLYNPDSDDTLHDRNFFAQLSYSNFSLEKLKFRGIAKFNWDATAYHEVDAKYTGGYKDENYWQREAYLSAMVLYQPILPLSLSYASDYCYNNLSSNSTMTVGPWRHSIYQTLSAKLRLQRMEITGRLLCSIFKNGVKQGESVEDREKLSPSLSLVVQPFNEHLFFVRASYKNIFRVPTFNESYYYRMGSLQLKPEETNQYNLGLTWQYGPRGILSNLVVTGDVYYNQVKDKIVAIPMNMYIWSMANLDKVRAFGADVTVTSGIDLGRGHQILFAGNYSWQRVQPRTSKQNPDYNKQVAYTPIHSGAGSLTWVNPWLDVVVKASGAGDRYGTNTNLPVSRIKGYMEFGASLMREFRVKKHTLDLRLDLLNIFDTQYEIVAAYPMPGRSWQFTLGFGF